MGMPASWKHRRLPDSMGDALTSPHIASAEEVIDPLRPICDAHHHLWTIAGQHYLLPELLHDASSGHRIVSTVYAEWRSNYYTDGPEALRPVGETAFAARVAQRSAALSTKACAGIVGFADLTLAQDVERVLDVHERQGLGRFRGVRHVGAWDAEEIVRGGPPVAPPGLYSDTMFRSGLKLLAKRGLSFDAWVYQTQLADVIELAEAFPDLTIILNHLGGVLGIGPYAGRGEELFADWRSKMRRLAKMPNVHVKIGGLGMKRSGFGLYGRTPSAGSIEAADCWRPWIEAAVEDFGSDRCMFESNFPVDRASCSYVVLWNAFKRICAGCSDAEKSALFHDTASRVYRL